MSEDINIGLCDTAMQSERLRQTGLADDVFIGTDVIQIESDGTMKESAVTKTGHTATELDGNTLSTVSDAAPMKSGGFEGDFRLASEDTQTGGLLELAATRFDSEKIIELLADPDIDVNDINIDGRNALHEMVYKYTKMTRRERTDVKKKLIGILAVFVDKGLDVNALFCQKRGTQRDYKTAIHLASCSPNSGDIIRALFSSGAKVNSEDGKKRTPLHLATDNVLLSNIQALLDGGADPNKADEFGQTSLHYAVKGRSRPLDIIETLIEAGATVNARDDSHKTPVHVAAKHAKAKVMKVLLAHGGHVNKADGTGQSPIHYAAMHDCSGDVLKELMKISTSDLNMQNEITDETPLHKAVRHRMTENVATLCESGKIDANVGDIFGETPIHKAVKLEDWNMWLALLKAGGDIYRENSNGVTPLILLKREYNKLGPMLIRYHKERTTEV